MSDLPHLVGRPVRGTSVRRMRRQEGGRICADPSCTTFLSTYNSSSYCWIHEPRRPPRTFGRQRLRQPA